MLAIRMQRTGRKGYPMYRVIVQEAHRQPTSGRVVANLGSYNPHTKETTLNTEKAAAFLKNGAQPSDRVVKLLQAQKV
nr:30S ribosomal protein S16 [Candidatus Saccharibacteria bacterium]